MTQQELADLLGWDRRAISELENAGKPRHPKSRKPRDLKRQEHGRLARALDVTVAELNYALGDTGEPVEIRGVTARARKRGSRRPNLASLSLACRCLVQRGI
jgi:transcriptional regulator with XRE-family HTH domain